MRPAPVDEGLVWRSGAGMSWLEGHFRSATVAFTTRPGGSSESPFDSLNLGSLVGDDPAVVERNREQLLTTLGRPERSGRSLRQVHGAEPRLLEKLGDPHRAEGDAIVTGSDRVSPMVVVADCYPVALALGSAVAIVHCGWRGTAAGVLERTFELLRDTAGEEQLLEAAIGPGIGPCCYFVGEELLQAFGIEAAGETSFDLGAEIRSRLIALGAQKDDLLVSGICTSCHSDLYFSYRRDGGTTGRQAGLVWLDS